MIGNILRYARICNDLTVKQVADKIGTRSSYVCDLESGRKGYTLKALDKFADCYDIEVSKILEFDELEDTGKNRKEMLKVLLEYYIEKENKQKNISQEKPVQKTKKLTNGVGIL